MQQKIYTITLFVSLFLFISFSDGPAGGIGNNGVRKQDRSGSPFANSNGPTCAACHHTGIFTPGLQIDLMDQGMSVNNYEPGKTYQLRYTLSSVTGNPSAYGIQSVILTNNGNSNAGQFGTPPTGTRIAPISDRSYFELSTPSSSPVFEIDWTAPDTGTGKVTVYVGGVVSNLDNDNDNDNGIANTLEIDELISSSTSVSLNAKVNIFPNPADKYLNISFSAVEQQTIIMNVIDIAGKIVLQEGISLYAGKTNFQRNIESLKEGVYFVQLIGKDNQILTRKLIKS